MLHTRPLCVSLSLISLFRCTNICFQKELICSRTGNLLWTCPASAPLRWPRWGRMGWLLEAITESGQRSRHRGRHLLQHEPLQRTRWRSSVGCGLYSAPCSCIPRCQRIGLQSADPSNPLCLTDRRIATLKDSLKLGGGTGEERGNAWSDLPSTRRFFNDRPNFFYTILTYMYIGDCYLFIYSYIYSYINSNPCNTRVLDLRLEAATQWRNKTNWLFKIRQRFNLIFLIRPLSLSHTIGFKIVLLIIRLVPAGHTWCLQMRLKELLDSVGVPFVDTQSLNHVVILVQ